MAACGSLRHVFERPLPENPTLMESLSWSQIKAVKPAVDAPAFTEIFGELHFEERRSRDCPVQSPPAPSPALDRCSPSGATPEKDRCTGDEGLSAGSNPGSGGDCCYSSLDALLGVPSNQHGSSPRGNGIFSPKSRCESLQLCTEGLGFESSDDVEDSRTGPGWDCSGRGRETAAVADGSKRRCSSSRSDARPRSRGEFPPPISCIGSGGKPWVCFRSYRQDGRFVLREVKIPTQELLRASREDGRLKLHFVQPDEEVVEEGGQGEEGEGGAEEGEEAEEGGEEAEGADEEIEEAGGEREEPKEEIGAN